DKNAPAERTRLTPSGVEPRQGREHDESQRKGRQEKRHGHGTEHDTGESGPEGLLHVPPYVPDTSLASSLPIVRPGCGRLFLAIRCWWGVSERALVGSPGSPSAGRGSSRSPWPRSFS